MSKSFRKDLTGQRFGRLTVLGFVPTEGHRSFWRCQCDCGKKTLVNGVKLTGNRTKSCGCIRIENAITQGKKNTTHGKKNTRLYHIWNNIKERCENPNQHDYHRYGGRGIAICDEWRNDFQVFYDWAMSNGYDDNLTIDRIDFNGNYTPENCRFVDMKTQQRNRRNNVIVKYNGKSLTLPEAAERSGISCPTLRSRYRVGDRGERLFRPIDTRYQRKNK